MNERLEARGLSFDLDVTLAFLVYVAASFSDFLMTRAGLVRNEIVELNFIIRGCVDALGISAGILVPKFILAFTAVLAGTVYLNHQYKRNRTRIKPQYILYPGALLTACVGASWVLQKYIYGLFFGT
jgi:hypothetical protein